MLNTTSPGLILTGTTFCHLASPEAVIDTSCPIGLKLWGQSILTGSTATCMCRLTVIGFPPGQARWYDKGGSSVGADNSVDRSSTLSVFYKLSGNCRYSIPGVASFSFFLMCLITSPTITN